MTDDKAEFQSRINVSRETIEKLEIYEQLLKKWNQAINLISKSTANDIWQRHFLDSAAVFEYRNTNGNKWLDVGSGAGLPGLVAAIIATELSPELRVTCIESDLRKCEFLRTVARNTETPLKILTRRVEDAPAQQADTMSARALAPLNTLLLFANQHLAENGTAVFHKGQDWKTEVENARKEWQFDLERFPSATNPTAVILKITNISHV